MTALWKLFPVTTLTIRQFMGGRTARLALFLSCIPALFAAIFLARSWGVDPDEFLNDLFVELIVPTLMPIVVLLPATGAFGDELEDGTLPYLLMKPVSRLRLVVGKYVAAMLVSIPSLLIGLALTTFLASRVEGAGETQTIYVAMAGAAVAGAMLLTAVFLLVSLIVPRALLAGMIYIFAWESLLGRFLPGVQAISSREYTIRIFNSLLDQDTGAAGGAAATMAVIAVVCLLVAVWRLHSMQVNES